MSAVVLLDQSAAFDLFDYGTLTAKMSALKFSHEAVSWFEKYLVGSVEVDPTLSPQKALIR